VHPFEDGNGRVARAAVNAELIAGRERRLFIPVSYREDYLLALRALSRQKEPKPLIRMLDRAQAHSAAIDFRNLSEALAALARTGAFEAGGRLRLSDHDT
jgi:fido (protein-threonine AMPylation protein)